MFKYCNLLPQIVMLDFIAFRPGEFFGVNDSKFSKYYILSIDNEKQNDLEILSEMLYIL